MSDISSFKRLAELRTLAESILCRYCARPMTFDKTIRNQGGKMQALNSLDLSLHRCWVGGKPPAMDEESAINSVIALVVAVNQRLSSVQLRCTREPKLALATGSAKGPGSHPDDTGEVLPPDENCSFLSSGKCLSKSKNIVGET